MLLFACITILTVLVSVTAHPVPHSEANAASRYRRKVGQLEVGSTAFAYMTELLESIADENYRPKDFQRNPTSVWCLLDSGRSTCKVIIS